MTEREEPIIIGDVSATADVTLNSKGGSTTATLKKVLRDRLAISDRRLTGAAIEFEDGNNMLVLAGRDGSTGAFTVRKTGRNRFEIELDTGSGREIGDIEAAFLRLKLAQFKRGVLPLSAPMTSVAWKRLAKERLAGMTQLLKTSRKKKPG